MMSPTVSSELERMCDSGRSARETIFGARGSVTSTEVKFLGALSCASHRMRLPSLASCIDMPSPMPPKPSSELWPSSLKFQISVSLVWLVALWAISLPYGEYSAVCRSGLDLAVDRAVGQLGHGADGGPRHPPDGIAGAVGAHRQRAFDVAGHIEHPHQPRS